MILRQSLFVMFLIVFISAPSAHSETSVLTYAQLKNDIQSHGIVTTEEFLSFIAHDKAYAPMAWSAVLERRSGALHDEQVTAAFPRIVTGQGNLSLHLTADPSRLGHQLVEIIEFVPSIGEFRFHLINFALAKTRDFFFDDPTLLNPDPAESDRMFELYGKTTGGTLGHCDSCHLSGYNLSPREDLAEDWGPGISNFRVYGGLEGRVVKNTEEALAFGEFRRTLMDASAGRLYRALGISFVTAEDGDAFFPNRPLERFDQHVTELARKRAAAKITRFSRYPVFSFSIVGALLNCRGLPEFLPDPSRTVHEKKLRDVLGSPESPLIRLSGIHRDEVRDEFWKKVRTGENASRIPESEFLAFTTLPLLRALGVEIRADIEGLGLDDAPYVQNSKLSLYRRKQAAFLDPDYVQRLANMKYLFRGYYPDVPSQIYSFLNEVTQETTLDKNGTFKTELSAAASYRIDGATEFLADLLAVDLGPTFLEDNPELDQFRDHRLRAENLTIDLEDYCERLKRASGEAFSQTPLRSRATRSDLE